MTFWSRRIIALYIFENPVGNAAAVSTRYREICYRENITLLSTPFPGRIILRNGDAN